MRSASGTTADIAVPAGSTRLGLRAGRLLEREGGEAQADEGRT